MNLVIIAAVVVILTFAVAGLLAFLFSRLGNLVTSVQAELEQEKTAYNPRLTQGHAIALTADPATQLKEARLLAARQAAALPRGANMRIGRGQSPVTAFEAVDRDPVTAVKIAQFHTWQGVAVGPRAAQAAAVPAPGVTQAAPSPRSAAELKPGVDYPFIEITESMSPAEKRKARIANAKAKSAATKALKEAATVAAPAAAVAAAPGQVSAAAVPRAAAAPAGQLVAGQDYPVIEIHDGMSPDEVRKARIANAKAKSAAAKALKEAGGVPAVAQAAAPAPAPADPAPAAPLAANVPPPPDYIEISEDMDPAEVRRARIANARLRSAYNKALKAAGIDPASVS